MHILLPPSETKRSEGGNIFIPTLLSHDAALRHTRAQVRQAAVTISEDESAAVKALGLGVKNRHERLYNLQLGAAGDLLSGAMPAIERYTGVLYDAIDVCSLDTPERDWIDRHVSVQSALFGLVAAHDLIPAYRLSASSRVPQLGAPLKRLWSDAHARIDWQEFGWVIDLRSKDYVALAPLPQGSAAAWLHVAQRSADGEVRALNHFNKKAKGELVRLLAETQAQVDGPDEFIDWAKTHGLDVYAGPNESELTLVTEALVATR